MNESVPEEKEAAGHRTPPPTGSLPSQIQNETSGKYNEYVEGGKEEKPTNKEKPIIIDNSPVRNDNSCGSRIKEKIVVANQ